MFEFSDLAPTLFEAYSENAEMVELFVIDISNVSRMILEQDRNEQGLC